MKAIMSPMAMTTTLKKELDWLKLKLENLRSMRERLLSSVETRVSNRRAIFVKLQAVNQRKASEVPSCEETLNIKIVAELRQQTRKSQRLIVALDARLEIMHEKREILRKQLEEFGQNICNMTNQQEQLRLKLKEAATNKTSQLLATALQQRLVKWHHEFKSNKWKIQVKLSVEEDIIEAQRKCVVLHELMQEFQSYMPELQDKLEIISLRLDLAIKCSAQPSGVENF